MKRLCNLKYFCIEPEKVEGYDKAMTDTKHSYHIHHRLETHFSDGTPRPYNAQLTVEELIALDMYYNRPANELIILTASEHKKLHTPWNKDKVGVEPRSEETKKKISDYQKTHTNSGRWKKGQAAYNKGTPGHTKGKKRFTNGVKRIYAFECPEGFWPGLD